MGRELIILSGRDWGDFAGKAGKIAEFMGVPHFKILQGIETPEKIIDENLLGREKACIIVSTHTLGKVFDTTQRREKLKDTISRENQVLFLYGISDSPADAELVKQLTNNSIVAAKKCQESRLKCQISSEARSICQQLSSASFEVDVDPNTSTFLVENNVRKGEVLATLDGEPLFMRVAAGKGEVFLTGCSQIADVDEHVTQGKSLLSYFTSLIPLMMVLRHVYQTQSWHNSRIRACFIIDDPLLKNSYGFLDYQKILKIMEEKRFCTSIAFIPWNYRRTNRDVALLFQKHGDKFSLSIHGCDHTGAELGTSDETLLRYKAVKVFERMTKHQQLSGVPFDNVMVFPQGLFSTFAMKALKSCGYLAAVNSTPYPVDLGDDSLTLRELLDVAITRFSNLPLFVRRYPTNPAELAFDMFLGKPALIVEHHGFFRNGYGVLSDFVDKLNSLEGRLEWSGLAEICSHASLKRVDENGDVHVKFYADRFRLENDTDRPQNYLLFRRVLSEEPLMGVRINGLHAEFEQETDSLKIPLSLNARQVAEIRVERSKLDETPTSYRQGRSYHGKVFVRRLLSEFRDNYVDKSPLLNGVVTRARHLLVRKKRSASPALMSEGLE